MLTRVINPGVPWYVALACNALAGIALVLLILDPDANLPWALALLGVAAVALYGTVLVRWWRRS
jgi:hypothetical protein